MRSVVNSSVRDNIGKLPEFFSDIKSASHDGKSMPHDSKPSEVKSSHQASATHIHVANDSPKEIKKNNGWSTIIENEVKSMSELSKAYCWLHYKSSRIYARYNNRITIAILIITTALMLPNLVNPESIGEKTLLRIFNVILTIIIAFLSGFTNLKNYAGRCQSHKEAAQQFSRIHDTIRQELLLYRKDRHEANDFVEYQSQILDIYVTSCPDIEDDVVRMFKKKFGEVRIQLPNFMNDSISQFDVIFPEEVSNPKKNSSSEDNALAMLASADSGFDASVQQNSTKQNSVHKPTDSPIKKSKSLQSNWQEAIFGESRASPRRTSQITPKNDLKIGVEEDDKDVDSDEEQCATGKAPHAALTKLRFEMNRFNTNLDPAKNV